MIEFKLWLLFIGRMSIFAENQHSWVKPEMRKTVQGFSLISWETVGDRLNGYLWIGVLHDNGGKKAFEDATIYLSEASKG